MNLMIHVIIKNNKYNNSKNKLKFENNIKFGLLYYFYIIINNY